MDVRVVGTPDGLRAADLEGATAVVIDVLRMTSVAVTAIAHGCVGLMAVAEVDEARALAGQYDALLGGERMALPVEGFDFSNSPFEYTQERVSGRRLVMTTSNGTQAILKARPAERVLLGAFINVSYVAQRLTGEKRVVIICAGTLGAFTLEDALAAGCIVDKLLRGVAAVKLDDMALAAHRLYRGARDDLHAALAQTTHYGRLQGLGLAGDLKYCLREDTVAVAPERGMDGWFA